MKRKFLQNKLWRDNAPRMMEENHGSVIHWRRLDDSEYDSQLRIKLVEEMDEVCKAQTRNELKAEIADVYEVLDALMKLHAIEKEEVDIIQLHKRSERGGFEGRTFVDVAEHPLNSFGERYCLADPVKYPEIE
jgi:predicted house-cleaning noncanonical NTP pyrophosphatase (MazG superfamily)